VEGAIWLLADGADWRALYMVVLSGMLMVLYQIRAAEYGIFCSAKVVLAFVKYELLVSFSTIPSIISSWYFA
jgi:hypothetical protein